MSIPGEFQNVRVFDLGRRGKTHLVRWRVDGRDCSRSFPTKVRADRARRRLLDALDSGDRFDTTTGLPESWVERPTTIVEFAVQWHARNRAGWGAKTADTHRESLMHVLAVCCDEPPTGDLRGAVRTWISDACSEGDRTQTLEVERAGEWLAAHSMPLAAITPGIVRDRLLPALGVNLDGRAAKANTLSKRRTTLTALMGDAVGDELIASNPTTGLRRTRAQAESTEVDVRTIPTVREFELFIMAVANELPSARRQVAFLAFTLYTGARPGECSALRVRDLLLPADGWGEAILSGSHTTATKRSTADGTSRRGLKARAASTTRVVPLPPQIVALLRTHLELFPPGPDGYVFRNSEGGLLSVNQSRVITRARRALGWTDGHPFADTTHYTGRHVYISSLIREGVDPVTIAKLCGNSPAVVLSEYAAVFAQMADDVRPKILAALG